MIVLCDKFPVSTMMNTVILKTLNYDFVVMNTFDRKIKLWLQQAKLICIFKNIVNLFNNFRIHFTLGRVTGQHP